MRYSRKIFGAVLILALASLVVVLPSDMARPASQSDLRSVSGAPVPNRAQQESSSEFFASQPVTPSVTLAASELPAYVLEYTLDREINPRLSYNSVVDPNFNPVGGPDPLLGVQESTPAAQPNAFGTPLLNFNGQGYTGVNPPDTVGDVGPGQYIQMINGGAGALVQIYNKATGAPIGSQFALNDLATGGPCQSGLGDPIVLYDKLADRWLLSEFASSGNHLCVYVSTGPNPGGTYYFYDFTTPTFPDYPKYAVWPDAYYVTANESNPTAYALNRTRMLSGLSATFQRFTAPALAGFGFQSLTPADLDGATPPPAGSPGLFMRHRDTEVHGPAGFPAQDLLEVWAFAVNWTTPASSSFTKIADIQVAEFDSTLCGLTSFSCVPQPGTSVQLDPLREVVMWRLAYRNFGSRQVLVGNFTTDVNGNDRAGVRWFELRKTGSAWSLYQQGTYAPGTINRWMGGIAMDGSGNIALGYNVSDSTTYPGIRYAGRLATDTLGTLPQGEHTLVNGTASNNSNRYGDYSAMSVDPSDDCTFWFTGQWNAAGTWSTRIGKLKFDECGPVQPLPARVYLPLVVRNDLPTTGTVSGRVTNAANSQGIPGAQVCVLPSQCATANSQGNYSIANVPAGSQTVRATATGYGAGQQNVTVIAGGTVTANFALVAAPTTGTVSGRVTRASNSQAIPGAQVCVLSSNQCANTNAQGNYSITDVAAGSQTVRATANGFTAAQQNVTVPAGGTVTANFSLVSTPASVTITQSQSQSVVDNNSVACFSSAGSAENAYLRQFPLTAYGITGPFNVTSVRFGIETADSGGGSGQPLTVRLYRKTNPAGSLTYGNLTQIGSASRTVSDQTLTLYTVTVAGNAPAGSVLVVEVYTPDGQGSGNFFFIGSNAAGQTGSSYLAAAACGAPEPTTTGALGFPDMHIVMNVTGTTSTANLEQCVTIGDTVDAAGSALCTAISDLDADSGDAAPASLPEGSLFRWMNRSDLQGE